jgi:hypothetical protein
VALWQISEDKQLALVSEPPNSQLGRLGLRLIKKCLDWMLIFHILVDVAHLGCR